MQYEHPLVKVQAAPLFIQLPAHVFLQATENGSSAWVPAHIGETHDRVLGLAAPRPDC